MIRELRKIDINNANLAKVISWKADVKLCDLIMSKPMNLTEHEAEKWIQDNSVDDYQEFLGIHLNNELVGIARLMFINPEDRIAEIGLYIGGTESRGTGLGRFTLIQLENIAKEKWVLNKVFARVRETNISSIQLFRNQGFLPEGILKQHYKSQLNAEWDSIVYLSKFIN